MLSLSSKVDDTPQCYITKTWGYERVIVNNTKFCGKILVFNKGKFGSYHWHRIKEELFYLQSGKLKIRYADHNDLLKAESRIMSPGDSMHIYPGLRHRIIALEDSELFEFSTQDFEEDSIKIVPAGVF